MIGKGLEVSWKIKLSQKNEKYKELQQLKKLHNMKFTKSNMGANPIQSLLDGYFVLKRAQRDLKKPGRIFVT